MPATARCRIRESVSFAGRVDRTRGIIRDVKIIGQHSVNNRRYLPEALKAAVKQYANKPCYANHPDRHKRGETRPVEDKIGRIINPRYVNGEIRGDLKLLLSHPMTPRILESAEADGRDYMLSHNAAGTGKTDSQGIHVVEEITEVESVDLVSDGGTTTSLFESGGHQRAGSIPCSPADLARWLHDTSDSETPTMPRERRKKKALLENAGRSNPARLGKWLREADDEDNDDEGLGDAFDDGDEVDDEDEDEDMRSVAGKILRAFDQVLRGELDAKTMIANLRPTLQRLASDE